MPRGPRISFERAFYHVFNRGAGKATLFYDDADYHTFLRYLYELKTVKHYDHEIYAYVLMPNHFHLLIQTITTPISTIMSSLSTRFSMYFNKTHHHVGPVFQNRFRSKLCEKDTYFLGASRYILLNPVKAGLVPHPRDYPWGCYHELSGQRPRHIITEDVSRLIGEMPQEQAAYLRFIDTGLTQLDTLEKNYAFSRDIEGSAAFYSLSQKKYLRRRRKNYALYDASRQ